MLTNPSLLFMARDHPQKPSTPPSCPAAMSVEDSTVQAEFVADEQGKVDVGAVQPLIALLNIL